MAAPIQEAAGKAAARSRGVLGPLVAIVVVVVAQLFGESITPEEQTTLVQGVGDVIVKLGVIAGSVVGIYGRIRASQPINRVL